MNAVKKEAAYLILEDLKQNENLTNTERELAAYILTHLSDVMKMKQDELARAAYVSTATVSRLCQKTGVSSYSDFRVALAKEVENLNGNLADKNYPFRKGDSNQRLADNIYSVMAGSLMHAHDKLELPLLDRIARELYHHKYIDIYGLGGTISTALNFAEGMSRIGKQTMIFDNLHKQANRASSCDKETLVIIISVSGANSMLITVAKRLFKRRIPILLITNNPVSPIVSFSSYVYLLNSDEDIGTGNKIGPFSTHVKILYFLNVLYSVVFRLNYDENVKRVAEYGKLQAKNF